MDELDYDIVIDAKRFLKGYYPSGNDCLYEFCDMHPISTINTAAPLDPLTKEEACFADQMWLIGRSYAASPERYSYTGKISPNDAKPVKPKEILLGSEGYESFFQDITRMLFRNESHDQDNPVIYLRGQGCSIKKRIPNQEDINKFNDIWKDLNEESKDSSVKNCRISIKAFENLEDRAKDCSKQLGGFSASQIKELLNPGNDNARYSLISLTSLSNAEGSFKTDLGITKEVIDCVFKLADFLNSARVLRDIAITLSSFKKAIEIWDARKIQEIKGEHKRAILNLPRWLNTLISGKPSLSISFCSKFLHFHNPQVFFIFDSISSSKSKEYESKILSSLPQKDLALLLEKTPKPDKTVGSDKSANNNEDKRIANKRLEYGRHIENELKIAYAFYISLLNKSKNKDEKSKKLLNKIRASCNAQNKKRDTTSASWSYSITRIVDELVTNSDVNHASLFRCDKDARAVGEVLDDARLGKVVVERDISCLLK